MQEKRCSTCGAPRRVTGQNVWTDGGAIVARKSRDYRMMLMESDYVSRILAIIEEAIGIPLGRMVVELARKMTYEYVSGYMPAPALKVTSRVALKPFAKRLLGIMDLNGFGKTSLRSIQNKGREDDHLAVAVENPYYLPSFSGILLGGMEAVTGKEASAKSEETAPGTYLVTAYLSPHPVEFRERLSLRRYPVKPGDMSLERCPSCGGPAGLSAFEWDPERGMIHKRSDGRRMAMGAFGMYEALFQELERELGEHIPRVIVDSARRFVAEDLYTPEEVGRGERLREQLALRGLGNLRELTLGKEEMRVRLENARLHLVMVGMFQGFFELIFGRRGEAEWELAGDGDLSVSVAA